MADDHRVCAQWAVAHFANEVACTTSTMLDALRHPRFDAAQAGDLAWAEVALQKTRDVLRVVAFRCPDGTCGAAGRRDPNGFLDYLDMHTARV